MVEDFDYKQFNEVIHSRIRLAIMSVLATVEEAEFTFIRDRVKTTDGNLSIHLRKLENAGYVSMKKGFVGRKPVTTYKLTAKGRRAFEIYLERIENLIEKVKSEKGT